jgi:DNA mismatch endonuclease (patch repair protein)
MTTDVFAPAQRSAVMRSVKSRDTAPELQVRALVRSLGFARRYRLGGAGLPGKPDLVFGGLRKAIFVHGCFWHGHACARGARAPKANAAYWRAKIARNRARDLGAVVSLRAQGWRVLIVWECTLRDRAGVERRLSQFLGV